MITGGSVFFRFVTLEGKSYVYSSCDKVWEDYIKEGLQPVGSKEIRIDENAKEIGKDGKAEKETTVKGKSCENGSAENDVSKKNDDKEEKKESTPKVIEIKPDSVKNDSVEEKEPAKAVPKPKLGRPRKDGKKKAPSQPPEEPKQESFTIETNSSDFLNPSLQTLHIDKKFVISSADVLSENSLSLHDDENSGVASNDSSSVPIVLFPNQPTFQLDPSLVSNGASNFIPVPANDPILNPQQPKKKRKPRKRSESPEPKKEKVDVKCNVCMELYAKRQDNRRYGRWIGCSACPIWVHAKCVGWTEADIDSAKDYFCLECEKKKEENAKNEEQNGKTEGKSPNKAKATGKTKTENPKKKRKIEKEKDEKKETVITEETTVVSTTGETATS